SADGSPLKLCQQFLSFAFAFAFTWARCAAATWPQPRGRGRGAGRRPDPDERCSLDLNARGVKAGEQVAGHSALRGARGVSWAHLTAAQGQNGGKGEGGERQVRP